MFSGPFSSSIIKRASASGKISIEFINLRDFTDDRYKSVDDHPYGGGAGMVLRVDVIDKAIQSVVSRSEVPAPERQIVLLCPQGTTYTQNTARELSRINHLIFLCGHYEGVDERVRNLVDREISIGDYVLTGGEIPAMVLVDSVVRLIPGVLAKADATQFESFEEGLLEYPQYTRPENYNGSSVPSILLSGNHAKIRAWQKEQATLKTKKRRPDLA